MGGAIRGAMLLVCLTLTGCAAGFRGISPGMTSAQVRDSMGDLGPTKVTPYHEGYSSWYYGDDQCLLMKDNVVVSKDVTSHRGGLAIRGVGGFSVAQQAQCSPPWVSAAPNTTLDVGISGALFGFH